MRFAALLTVIAACADGAHFTQGTQRAVLFGVHEIVLEGSEPQGNPFDAVVTVTFNSPQKQTIAVKAFYDDGRIWRARLYVSAAGKWTWSTTCTTDVALHAKTGAFEATASKLRGRLLPHPKNPRQWMTENGRWFLNLNDTAYFLLSRFGSHGKPVDDAAPKQYVRDLIAHGITSVRSFSAIGPSGSLEDSDQWRDRWRDTFFTDDTMNRLQLDHLQTADQRLRWLLDEYPDLYVQFILFPRGARWGREDELWRTFTPQQKQRVMDYMIARYAAYPQIFWLIVNDAHYGEKFPANNAYAREVGEYFAKHDPWRHPMSTGHARRIPYYFAGDQWSTYIHLEEAYDVDAKQMEKYRQFAKPVFLGEDRYEQDRPDLDPLHMDYFQRRLFWSWLLAGGSTNYGGRWWTVDPYTRTGTVQAQSPWKKEDVFTKPLHGLDSVRVIRDYFVKRNIDLSAFQPAEKGMRRGQDEFLIYLANGTGQGRNIAVNPDATASVRLDLRGEFTVEWLRAKDGATHRGKIVKGVAELTAPWKGEDVIVRLTRK